MSKIKNLFELCPPDGPSNTKEFFETGPVECGYCHGRGFFAGPVSENHTQTCPNCKGTGYLKAEVIVSWIPTDKIQST